MCTVACMATLKIFWLQKLQLLAVFRVQLQSGCNICNHQLQLLLVAMFATLSCKLCNYKNCWFRNYLHLLVAIWKKKEQWLHLGSNPWPFTPNPDALLSELSGMMKISVGNANFPLYLQLLGAASNRCNICI